MRPYTPQDYAALGWQVLPCVPGKKRPYVKWDQATNDPAAAVELFAKYPEAEVGVLTGPSQLAVIDRDMYKPGYVGHALPDVPSWRMRTPSGGFQDIYRDLDGTFPTDSDIVALGVDRRGVGGLFIAPSAASPKRVWLDTERMGDIPPGWGGPGRSKPKRDDGWREADALPAVVRWISAPCPLIENHSRGGDQESLSIGEHEDGRVVVHCNKESGDCTPAAIRDALVAAGTYDRDQFYSAAALRDEDAEFEALVAADLAAEAQLRDATDFPIDALPPALAQLVVEGSRAICCPPDYIGAAGLAILGAAIGGSIRLHVGAGWYERAALWVAIVGDPGARKSPALKPLMVPVWAEQKKLFAAASVKREAEKQRAKDDKRQPKYVPTGRVAVDDTTVEALCRTLNDNARGVLMHSDELVGWAKGMGAYKGGLGRDRQHWLSIWSGQTFTVDRKNDDGVPMLVETPFVGVVGGIQPGIVSDIAAGRDDGLIDRLLLAQGDAPAVRLTRDRIQSSTQEEYSALWQRLRYEGDTVQGADVEMSDEAWNIFQDWHDRTAADIGRVPAVLRGVWAKMPAQCARIALILGRCAERRGAVDGDTMQRAIQLAEYFMGQARRILSEAAQDTPYERQHAERMDQLEAWLQEHPGATLRQVLRSGPGRWSRKRESLDPVIRDLVASGRVGNPS